jgi:hypothetical protein
VFFFASVLDLFHIALQRTYLAPNENHKMIELRIDKDVEVVAAYFKALAWNYMAN